MSSFEFLSVLISVVVGLGMANMLTGVGRILHRSQDTKVSATFVVWTLFVFFYLIIYWWTVVFGWQEWQNWNLLIFMFVLVYGILLFLLSVIMYPTDMPESWDPHESFMRMRHWFFGVFLVVVVVEGLDSHLKDHIEEFSLPYFLMLGLWFAGGILGWISNNRRMQTIIATTVFVAQVSWVAYQLRDLEWSIQGI